MKYLITGGTGTLGHALTKRLLEDSSTEEIRIFSRGELLQSVMEQKFRSDRLTFIIGDVRDERRLTQSIKGIDAIIHAAALKRIPTGENNPTEMIDTNIEGSRNVISVAKNSGIDRVLGTSSDKAVYPINIYGATKMAMEMLFTSVGFSCVRYGNVLGSRGSIIPVIKKQRESGKIRITDTRVTRFWISQDEATTFILRWLELMEGGEIFVPVLPSAKLMDLVEVFAPSTKMEIVGLGSREKLHETLLVQEDLPKTQKVGNTYIVGGRRKEGSKDVPLDFRYTSDNNTWWLTKEEIRRTDIEY